jgi:hypothetical protein
MTISSKVDKLITLYHDNKGDTDFQDIVLLKLWGLVNEECYQFTDKQFEKISSPFLDFDNSSKRYIFREDWDNNKYINEIPKIFRKYKMYRNPDLIYHPSLIETEEEKQKRWEEQIKYFCS